MIFKLKNDLRQDLSLIYKYFKTKRVPVNKVLVTHIEDTVEKVVIKVSNIKDQLNQLQVKQRTYLQNDRNIWQVMVSQYELKVNMPYNLYISVASVVDMCPLLIDIQSYICTNL